MIRFLVVDDEPANRTVFKGAIEAYLGVEVKTAESAEQALEFFQSSHFDLVLTDKDMDNMDGVELSEKIRAINSMIPIVLMSGKLPTLKPASVNRMLWKPCRKEDIVALMDLLVIQ